MDENVDQIRKCSYLDVICAILSCRSLQSVSVPFYFVISELKFFIVAMIRISFGLSETLFVLLFG